MKNFERKLEIHEIAIDDLYRAVEELREEVYAQKEELRRLRRALMQLQDIVIRLHRSELSFEDIVNMFPLIGEDE